MAKVTIQESMNKTLGFLEQKNLAEECSKLDTYFEQKIANRNCTRISLQFKFCPVRPRNLLRKLARPTSK